MEGNYRIVQLSDSEFVIEKEVINEIKYPWYTFKKKSFQSSWHKVNTKGKIPNFFNSFDNSINTYSTSDLKVAKNRLEQIKKYPLIIE